MIIRISGEGQYRLEGEALVALDRLDNHLLDALEKEDEENYAKFFQEVLCLIREKGTLLPGEELTPSDLVIPAPETTFTEAKELFAAYPRDLL